jgi:hypothetical protein
MSSRKQKRLHDIHFDPDMQPGKRGRYTSLDGFMGERISDKKSRDPADAKYIAQDIENPFAKYKSLQDPRVKPNIILRKKGYNPF